MEHVLELYRLPYDPRYPVVCMDEASKQLIGEVRIPLPVGEGQPVRYDSEYIRLGVCNQFMFVEPLRGWRKVFVRDRRTMIDWAFCIQEILDVHYPEAQKVCLVQDNLPPTREPRCTKRFLQPKPVACYRVWNSITRPSTAVG